MIHARGPDTVRVTKVKGHTTEADVEQGRVRMEDRLGNDEADTAAGLDRRHPIEDVDVLDAREFWYPIMLQLHRFMVAVSGSLSIMMVGVGRLLISLYGITGVGKSNARLTLG